MINLTSIIYIIISIGIIVAVFYYTNSYYIGLSVTALLILILALISVGLLIKDTRYNSIWPPQISPCPDSWIFNSEAKSCTSQPICTDGYSFNSTSKKCVKSGSTDQDPIGYMNDSTGIGKDGVNFTVAPFTTPSTRDINLKKWAINNGNVYWDGITNNDSLDITKIN